MRLRTAARVDATPSRRTLFQTSRTRSGRILAFCSRFFRANSDEARSVPTETKEAAVRTNTQPASNFGAGTSTTSISPPLTCWRSCFISCRRKKRSPAYEPLKTYSIRNCTMVSRSLSRFGSG